MRLTQLVLVVGSVFVAAIAAAAPIRVVTSTMDMRALVQAVGGDRVAVDSVATSDQDPHFIDPRPSTMVKLRAADAYVAVGMELEAGWLGPLLAGARNPRLQPGQPGFIDASQAIVPLDVPTAVVDRSAGDVHAQGNPHYWLDPRNGPAIADLLAARLGALFPEHRDAFAEHARAFRGDLTRRLDDPQSGWRARLKPFAGAKVLTVHRSWSYFLDCFGLVSVGELEPKPGIPPGPQHLAAIVDRAKGERVAVILVEPFYAADAAEFVAQRSGAKVLRVANSAADYVALFDTLTAELATALAAAQHEEQR